MIVRTQNKHFEGVRYGVVFSKGEARGVTPELAARLAELGYDVVEEKPEDTEKAEKKPKRRGRPRKSQSADQAA